MGYLGLLKSQNMSGIEFSKTIYGLPGLMGGTQVLTKMSTSPYFDIVCVNTCHECGQNDLSIPFSYMWT